MVLAAGGESEKTRQALSDLIEGYWYPVYGFVRSQGFNQEDANDLVQSYFATMMEKGTLGTLRPEAGRFRSFLLVSVRNFLHNERDWRRAAKRGGNQVIESLDTLAAEARLSDEPAEAADAEKTFERRWASTVVQRAIESLASEFEAAGQADRFKLLRGLLTGDEPTLPYRELSERMQMSEAGVKSVVHRMRKRFGVVLRGEVLQTVGKPGDVEDEIRYLLRVLAGN
ncbi:hypothetical protein ABI59_18045 [Acidobacteria bacterium Mor1]|nr:hypothetical protein ABI59_18045 [Acidobacteria bacterium Mor1]